MKNSEFLKIKAILEAAYPQWKADESTEGTWFEMLKDLNADVVANAVRRIIMTTDDRWPPSIGRIRNEAATLINPVLAITAEEAWHEVTNNVRSHGYCGCPTWSHEAIEAAVKSIGWREICLRQESDVAVRAHFFRIYEALQHRWRENALLPEPLRILIDNIEERKQLNDVD